MRCSHVQVDQHFARPRLRDVDLHDLGGHSAGVVIDGGLLFLGDLRGGHLEE